MCPFDRENAELVDPSSRDEWRRWLSANHERDTGVWFVRYHVSSPKLKVTYEDAVEEALCFGWIDSIVHAWDAESSVIWFSPRRKRSVWSPTNKARAERLIAQGLMTPAGLAQVEAAKADGRWDSA